MTETIQQKLNTRCRALALSVAALLLTQNVFGQGDGAFEMLTRSHDMPSIGFAVRDIEQGNYAKAIETLQARLGGNRQPHSIRAPVLIDLCVSYTVTRQLDEAEKYCDEAIDTGWYSAEAYNNRGAFNIAAGNYEAAVQDFQSALDAGGSSVVASENLQRAEARISELETLPIAISTVAVTTNDSPETDQ
jgi:tetratricopeptide (TPR) repeat protein